MSQYTPSIKYDNKNLKKKTWCIYTKEYYLTIKRNEIMSFAGKWMELEIHHNKAISERQILHVFAHMQNLDLTNNNDDDMT
jgi:hypothetical protein